MARTNDIINRAQQTKSLGDARAARDAIRRQARPVNVVAEPTITPQPSESGRVVEGGVVDYASPTVVGGVVYEHTVDTPAASAPVIITSDPASQNRQLVTPVVAAEPVTATPQEPTITYTYYAYDDQGREQRITQSQYEQLEKWTAENKSKNKTYNVVPAEVVNDSGGNWWINSEGQYEYIPATESAKARLNEINGIRSGSGLSAHSTLIVGASPSEEYSDKWYSTGGGNIGKGEDRVRVITSTPAKPVSTAGKDTPSSGSIKLAELNASSSVNNSASAKTNTAQTNKATVTPKVEIVPTTGQQSTKENPMISTASLTPFVKPDLMYSTPEEKAAITGASQEFKTVDQVKRETAFNTSGLARSLSFNPIYEDGEREAVAKNLTPFKTVDEVDRENEIAGIRAEASKLTKNEAVNDIIGSAYIATMDSKAIIDDAKSVVKTVTDSIKRADTFVSDFIPTKSEMANSRQSTIEGIFGSSAAESYEKKLDEVRANPIAGAVIGFNEGMYDEVRENPVTTGLEIVEWHHLTRVAGPVLAGLGKVAEAVPIVGKALSTPAGQFAAKEAGNIAGAGMFGMFAGSAAAEILSPIDGEAPTLDEMSYRAGKIVGGDLLPAVVGAELGSPGLVTKSAGRVIERDPTLIPGVKTAKVSELAGHGASITPKNLEYGYSFAPFDKPIVSKVEGGGFKIGAAGAPESALTGKTTQAFSNIETKFFKETVKVNSEPVESAYLESALNIGKEVSKTKTPPVPIKELDITSTAIPESMRPAIKEALTSYEGDLMVAGSVPMKAQAGEFVSRPAHDLEIYGDNEAAIAKHIASSLERRGYKQGIDYKMEAGKLEFSNNGKWDTGVEIFTHNQGSSAIMESPALLADPGKSEIAFGYNTRKPVSIENGKLEIQSLQEQVTRKIAGSTMFSDNTLHPAHPGRMKDPLDVITTSTSFAVNKGVPIADDIVKFTNSAFEKWGTGTDEFSIAFREKVAGDPLVKYIRENQKLPTVSELHAMDVRLPDAAQPTIYTNIGLEADRSITGVVDVGRSPAGFVSGSPQVIGGNSPSGIIGSPAGFIESPRISDVVPQFSDSVFSPASGRSSPVRSTSFIEPSSPIGDVWRQSVSTESPIGQRGIFDEQFGHIMSPRPNERSRSDVMNNISPFGSISESSESPIFPDRIVSPDITGKIETPSPHIIPYSPVIVPAVGGYSPIIPDKQDSPITHSDPSPFFDPITSGDKDERKKRNVRPTFPDDDDEYDEAGAFGMKYRNRRKHHHVTKPAIFVFGRRGGK